MASFLVLVILGVIGAIVGSLSSEHGGSSAAAPAPVPKGPSLEELEKSMQDLVNGGIVTKVEFDLNKVWVNSAGWQIATYDQKRTLGFVFAHYVALKKGRTTFWCEIYDDHSGKRLAKFSEAWGFSTSDE